MKFCLCFAKPKRICGICLDSMDSGTGGALFTAECSHVFHFDCIASSAKLWNDQECPTCRSKWKRKGPAAPDDVYGDGRQSLLRRFPQPQRRLNFHPIINPLSSNNDRYDDDESLGFSVPEFLAGVHAVNRSQEEDVTPAKVEMETHLERLSVAASECLESFSVLIHLKAPPARSSVPINPTTGSASNVNDDHVPIDLVAVLDVSGSMSGTKLSLLKQAMRFVIRSLGTFDRLSVVSFSSEAHRLFPLKRMTDSGRLQAIESVNSLSATGTTNIAGGLEKGAKVLEDRTHKNAVCSIILLTDGQDNHTNLSAARASHGNMAEALLPSSIGRISQEDQAQVPVHTFGFGTDHDAALMHAISEISGGTFSFIEAEVAIREAFARCIGGLLSVSVQDLQVRCDSASPGVSFNSIDSGSYGNRISDDRRRGVIAVGEMYAEEERDFVVDVKIPAGGIGELVALRVGCVYLDVALQQRVSLDVVEVSIQRPETVDSDQKGAVCIEVDRQKNRLETARKMGRAREFAEMGNLHGAWAMLGQQRLDLQGSAAGRAGDPLCQALDEELGQMQEGLTSQRSYGLAGRAQMLSGLMTHSTQRATTRLSFMKGKGRPERRLNALYGTAAMGRMVELCEEEDETPEQNGRK